MDNKLSLSLEHTKHLVDELSKELKLSNILKEQSKLLELYNKVDSLSNYRVASALMNIIKQISYTKAESNYETCCMYLEEAIKDLMSGMDATEMLWKYDMILYDLKYGHKKGYRAKVLIVDDLCDIDINDVIKNLYILFDAAWEENMNGRGTDITRMVTTFIPSAIQNLQAYKE